MKTKFIILLLLIINVAFSQGEANIWYFGYNAGLDFNSGNPVALTNGQLHTDEGCATLSNSSGQLLFYTDGITVYNRNHQIMPNGSGLLGHPSSSQSATIVPKPSSTNLFYVFTIDYESHPNGFKYSVIDLNLDGGLGDVTTQKNISVYEPTLENIAITKHNNGIDYWIVTHGWDNNSFNAYLLTSTGLSSIPVTTNIGATITGIGFQEAGYMKIAPSGSKLAFTSVSDIVQLFDFNNSTGVLSNEITLLTEYGELYGIEFSPNENVLYVTNTFNKLYQFDLLASDIPNSKFTLYNGSKFLGALQIAPDNKIYLAVIGQNKLGVIKNPDTLGSGCNFIIDEIDLAGRLSQSGLPAFNQSFFFTPSIQLNNVCVNQNTSFQFSTNQTVSSATWNFGDGTTSNVISPNHSYTTDGAYNVTVSIVTPYGTGSNTSQITIYPQPTLLTNSINLKQCDDNLDGFSAFNLNESISLLVSNPTGLTFTFHETLLDAQNNTNPISNTTNYTNQIVSNDIIFARIENVNGCFKTAQINLQISTTLIPSFFQIVKNECDDLASGSNNDGIATFDFSNATAQIQSLYPTGQLLNITYYKNLIDALAEQNQIINTSNYSNVGYPNIQNIYVRVDSQINNECLGLGHHITLNVERIPIVQPLTLKHCDDNHDGIFGFDTTHLQSLLLNGITNVEVSYTDQNGLPLTSPLPNPFITTSQTLTALVKNNFGNHCDYTTTVQFVVDDLPVATSINTNDITFCSNQNTVSVDTTTFEATILGSQTGMLVNYVDANTNSLSSPLPNPFVTPQQTISAQVINTANAACKTTVAIPIVVHSLPNISLIGDELICSDNPNFTKIINAGLINSATQNQHTYTWYLNNSLLPNQTNYSLTVNTEGVYKVEVKNSYGCVESRIITVTSSNKAVVDSLIINDLVDENSIEVILSSESHGNYVYSLDGVYFQSSATFSNILPGIYTVYIKDLKGCGTLPKEVSVLGIPKYFTPNGDGINDYWNMVGVNHKFNAKSTVFIYDRYGKLLYQTTPLSSGWDGTYNGEPMISSDYWYSVLLEDGRVIKGNFSLKR
ncbi:MAG: T9SS type B sorting domain-containing protein [Bacteroidia bacterium]|nr:T9SS type B sorting domain-containing protein [Bacteroidia bacterium]